jgi:hypothetical protein
MRLAARDVARSDDQRHEVFASSTTTRIVTRRAERAMRCTRSAPKW